ncbi:MAG: BrnT family toxin [Brevundimonas aurantiaca]|uniref:BrnT family toxin n=1 Tax=Brevundimonas aurantiaca TaxID=74316 RepID=UPI00391C5B3E
MDITYDEAKRLQTLEKRGLDFRSADQVFSGWCLTVEDDRRDYGEVRYQTLGQLDDDVLMVVWTPRGNGRRIISMRKCHGQELENYRARVGGP